VPYLHELTNFSPGRFFAINEIKLMLAVTLLRYDVKLIDGERPADINITYMALPNMNAEILFKRRT
jgi:hypothetical protein